MSERCPTIFSGPHEAERRCQREKGHIGGCQWGVDHEEIARKLFPRPDGLYTASELQATIKALSDKYAQHLLDSDECSCEMHDAMRAKVAEAEAKAYERCASTLEIFPIDDDNTMAKGFREWAAAARKREI